MRVTLLLSLIALGVGIALGYGDGEARSDRQRRSHATEVSNSTDVIRGRILTTDGQPVGGAAVSAHANSLPEALHETQSDASGHYRISDVGKREWTVGARHDDFRMTGPDGRGWAYARAGETADFTAIPTLRCNVDVRMPDGTQPDQAQLHWEPRDGYARSSWAPDNIVSRLAPGEFSLRATAGIAEEYESDTVRIVSPGPAQQVTLQLREPTGIRGSVVLPDGASARRLQVRVGPAVAFAADLFGVFGTRAELTRDTREFVIVDLPPGRYIVAAGIGGGRAAAHTEVVVAEGLARCTLHFQPQGRIVRVLGPDGQPAKDVGYSFAYEGRGARTPSPATVVKLGDGSAVVQSRGGEGTLLVGSHEFGVAAVPFDASGSDELVVRLKPAVTLQVTVERFQASGLAGQLFLHVSRPGYRFAFGARGQSGIDDKGVREIGPFQPGEVELVLGIKRPYPRQPPGGDRGQFWTIARERITIKSGKNPAWIAVPPLYPLKIICASGESGISITPTGGEQGVETWRVAVPESGELQLHHFAAGVYELSGRSSETMQWWKRRVTIPVATEVNVP